MFLGIDVSTYFEEKEAGAKYYIDHKEVDPIEVFKNQGVSYMRIRVWHNPRDNEGHPYLAGTNDIKEFERLSRLAVEHGMHIILDIHYSDFWADPGKQFTPKAWEGLSFEEIKKCVYEHTKDIFKVINKNHFPVDMVQVGNEITNGMIWPYGKLDDSTNPRGNYENLAALLKEGIRAVKEESNAKIIIHLEKSYDQATYDEYLSHIIKYGVEFDYVGMSYYPYWHGTFDQLFANVNMVQKKFKKEVIVIELGYGFTNYDYVLDENGQPRKLNEDDSGLNYLGQPMPYPITEEGQASFIRDFLKKAKENNLAGVCYWEPLWLPGPGMCWASKYAQIYLHEKVIVEDARNEWANQCFYDYHGNALPSLKEFKIDDK